MEELLKRERHHHDYNALMDGAMKSTAIKHNHPAFEECACSNKTTVRCGRCRWQGLEEDMVMEAFLPPIQYLEEPYCPDCGSSWDCFTILSTSLGD